MKGERKRERSEGDCRETCDSATLAGLIGSLTAVVSPELWESTFSPEGASQTVCVCVSVSVCVVV